MAVTKDPMLRGAANLSAGAADLRLSADKEALAKLAERELQPNRGIPLNLDWIENIRVNTSAVERRAQTLVTRRTVKKDWQVAWLLRAISCTDLTTLSGDDTDERVRRLCAKGGNRFGRPRKAARDRVAQHSRGGDLRVSLVCGDGASRTGGKRHKGGRGVDGFPAGLSPLDERVTEIRRSVEAGAHEIDVVITRRTFSAGGGRRCLTRSPRSRRLAGTRT